MQWKVYHTSLMLDKERVELNGNNCLAITKMISMECKKEEKINVRLIQCSGIYLDDTSPKSVLVRKFYVSGIIFDSLP